MNSKTNEKRHDLLWFSAFLIAATPLIATQNSYAQSRPGATPRTHSVVPGAASPTNLNLDLSSTVASISSQNSVPVNIMMGGTSAHGTVSNGVTMTVVPGSLLTPAQYIASLEAMHGHQTLLLNGTGAASGGSFALRANHLPSLASLTIPGGVSLNAIGFNINSPLNVIGDINVAGSMHLLQYHTGVTAAVSASNIAVASGGMITTALPAGLNLPNVFASSGLNLNVTGQLANQGTIFSDGNINLSSGQGISNISQSYQLASIIGSNVNLVVGNGIILNSGLIQAQNSLDLNTISPTTALLVHNDNGILRATDIPGSNGKAVITFRNSASSELANLLVSGGVIESNGSVNAFGKNIELNLDAVKGTLNTSGSSAHVTVKTGDLVLGKQELSGDPTYFNQGGDLIIGASTIAAGDLAFVASGDIKTTGPSTIQTTSGDHSIFLSAGFNFTTDGASVGSDDSVSTLTFDGTSNAGKHINFEGNSLSIQASGKGNITLISTGSASLGSGTITADAGNISIIANAGVNGSDSSVTSTAEGGGNITIAAATPIIAAGTTIQNGSLSQSPTMGALAKGDILLPLIQTNTGNINVVASDGVITANNKITSVTGSVSISNLNGEISGSGDISAPAGITLQAAQNISVGKVDSSGDIGGAIILGSSSGSVQTKDILSNGTTSGAISISAAKGLVVEGSIDNAGYTSAPISIDDSSGLTLSINGGIASADSITGSISSSGAVLINARVSIEGSGAAINANSIGINAGTGSILSSSSAFIYAESIVLQGGSIGSPSAPISFDSIFSFPDVAVKASSGDIYLEGLTGFHVGKVDVLGLALDGITGSGNIQLSSGSSWFINFDSSVTSTAPAKNLIINTDAVNVAGGVTLQAGSIAINGLDSYGSLGSGTALLLNNAGTISAKSGNIAVNGALGQDISFGDASGGQWITKGVNDILVKTDTTPSVQNNVSLGSGSQTFILGDGKSAGSVFQVSASGTNSFIRFESDDAVFSFPNDYSGVQLDTGGRLTLNPAQLDVHPSGKNLNSTLTLNFSSGFGIIANPNGAIDLGNISTLNSKGPTAFLAHTNISSSRSMTLKLGDSSTGFLTTFLAGMDISETANGYLITNNDKSSPGGNIDVSNVFIDTSSALSGADVLFAAQAGNSQGSGTVSLGHIATFVTGSTGVVPGTAGSVVAYGSKITTSSVIYAVGTTTSGLAFFYGGDVTLRTDANVAGGGIQEGFQNVFDSALNGTVSHGSASTAQVVLLAGKDVSMSGSINSGGTIIVADNLDISGNIIAGGGKGLINIVTATKGRTISLASSDSNSLSISQNEFNRLLAANLVIGSDNATGKIKLDGELSTFSLYNLELRSGGTGGSIDFQNHSITTNKNILLATSGDIKLGGISTSSATSSTISIEGKSVSLTGFVGNISDTVNIKATAGNITSPSTFVKITANNLILEAIDGNIQVQDGSALSTVVSTSLTASNSGSPGNIRLNNSGNISLTGSATASFEITNKGALTLSTDLNGETGVTLRVNGTSLNLAGHKIRSTDAAISVSTDSINFAGGNIDAGNGAITIAPMSSVSINLGGSSGLHLSNAELNGLIANSVTIGSTSVGNGITVSSSTGSFEISASFSLSMLARGGFNATTPINIANNGGDFSVLANVGDITTAKISNASPNGAVSLEASTGNINLLGSGSSIPSAHKISLLAGPIDNSSASKSINGLGSNVVITALKNGSDGGFIHIRGNNIGPGDNGISNITLNATGANVTGNGGSILFERTATTPFAPRPDQMHLNVSGGTVEGAHGSASIANGGDLTVSQGLISTSQGSPGKGAGIQFAAGILGTGVLHVDGAITAKAGLISLYSNSSTDFLISDAKAKNGVTGVLDVSGDTPTDNGFIIVTNRAGGIVSKTTSLSDVQGIFFDASASAAGSITVGKNIGNADTKSIILYAGKSGSISTGSALLKTNLSSSPDSGILLEAGSGAITATIETGSIGVLHTVFDAKTDAKITSVSNAPLNITATYIGGNLSITHKGDVNAVGNIVHAGKNLSISTTNGNIIVQSSMSASALADENNNFLNTGNGVLTLATSGSGNIETQGSGVIAAKTIILKGGTGHIGSASNPLKTNSAAISAGLSGELAITNGSLVGNLLTVSSIKTLNAPLNITSSTAISLSGTLSSVTSAEINANGALTINGTLGSTTANTQDIKLTAATTISSSGVITSATSLVIKANSYEGTIGSKTVPLKISTPQLSINSSSSKPIYISSVRPATAGKMTVNSPNGLYGQDLAFSSTSPVDFNTSVGGNNVKLTLFGANNISGNLTAGQNLTVSQTGAGNLSVSGDVSAGSINITTKGGGISVGKELKASGGNINITSAAGISVTGKTSANDVTINQQGLSSPSNFGVISAKKVTLNFAAGASEIRFNDKITATDFKLNETGSPGTITTFAPGADIVASNVSISTMGASTFHNIEATVGSVVVTTRGTSSFDIVKADSLAIKNQNSNVSINQIGGGLLSLKGGSAIGFNYMVSSSGSAGIEIGNGELTSTLNITLRATGKDAGIKLGSFVGAGSVNSTLTISASGNGSIEQTVPNTWTNAQTITLTSSTGTIKGANANFLASAPTIFINTKGSAFVETQNSIPTVVASANTSGGSFHFKTIGEIIFKPSLPTAADISLTGGKITLLGGLGSSSINGTNSISLTATGDITSKGVISTKSGGSISLLSQNGNLGTQSTPLKISTSNLLSAKAALILNISNSNKDSAGAVYGELAGSNVTLSSAGKSTFANSINTTGGVGNIKLTAASGLLTVNSGVQIHATGSSAQILLQELADTTGSGISLLSGSKLETDVTSTKPGSLTTYPVAGQISLIVGTKVLAPTNQNNPDPSQISVNILPPGGGQVYFGNQSSTISASNATVNVSGTTAVQLSSGTKASIVLDNNVIDADPPFGGLALPPYNNHGEDRNAFKPLSTAVTAEKTMVSSLTYSAGNSISNNSQIGSLSPNLTTATGLFISSTPNILPRENASSPFPSQVSSKTKAIHEIALSSNQEIFAPKLDSIIRTKFGTIEIAGGSIAIIQQTSAGLAIFNVHDKCRNAIRLRTGNHIVEISPGRHVALSIDSTGDFYEAVSNKHVAHRRVHSRMLGEQLELFESEFSIITATTAIPQLKLFLENCRRHKDARFGQILKTVVILQQLNRNSERYERPVKRAIVASNPQR